MMTVMEYVAKFTELTRFSDDYEATDMAKDGRFENGLELSIRGWRFEIVGLHLQGMDSMVGTALAIEKEIEGAWGIRVADAGEKREDQPFSSLGKRQKTFASHEFQDQVQDGAFSQAGQTICYLCRQPGHVRRVAPRDRDPMILG